ncbi:MAG TPA: glycosyltransferase family 9 protein, partial [Blastocatellia bacterium]|nr:glycosyltransferase family 9 protein [Blastocatellia bacterium]
MVRGANWIGDAVMTLPALERLRASFPLSHISLLATPLTTGLFESSPFVDEVIEYRRREDGVRGFIDAVRLMRARRFDLAALFQNAFEAALLTALGGARARIGFVAQGRGPLLTHKLHRGPHHSGRHQVHDYLDIVAECERAGLGGNLESRISSLNSQVSNPLPSLTASPAQRRAAVALLRRAGVDSDSRPIVALNAGATNSRAKRWPEDRFAALADRLMEALGSRIVFIGAASERDGVERIIRQMKRRGAINLAGETGLAELIGALDACDLLVSNDT